MTDSRQLHTQHSIAIQLNTNVMWPSLTVDIHSVQKKNSHFL